MGAGKESKKEVPGGEQERSEADDGGEGSLPVEEYVTHAQVDLLAETDR